MAGETAEPQADKRQSWWRSIGPALITACVVFGPGSLLISSNIGADYGYDLVWMLVLTGLLMGTYLTMGARIGVMGGATPCTLINDRLGRPAAALIGIILCLVCTSYQFSNNVAVAIVAQQFVPEDAAPSKVVPWLLVGFNGLIVLFLFTARQIYKTLERVMKVMVGLILACFLFNLIVARPDLLEVFRGFLPGLPEGVELGAPKKVAGEIVDPMIVIAGLLGTTFSVAGAFYQGNLVREKGWKIGDYDRSVGDAIAGVCVLTGVSMIIMITTATVIRGQPAEDIGTLASSLQPLLGTTAYVVFCVGLFAVAMNPFLINAMIGGSILADGLGRPPKLSDRWPRIFTVVVMLIGMVVALAALRTGQKPIRLIMFGQALTVLGNPLMAAAMLWLANRKDVMGPRRNNIVINILGGLGLVVVILMAIRVLWKVILQLT